MKQCFYLRRKSTWVFVTQDEDGFRLLVSKIKLYLKHSFYHSFLGNESEREQDTARKENHYCCWEVVKKGKNLCKSIYMSQSPKEDESGVGKNGLSSSSWQ